MENLKDRVALVTGSSQGIGRVIARELATAGCRVIVNCRNGRDKAEAVATGIRADGGMAEVYCCDVSDEAAVNAMFAELGPVDILVNNARLDPWQRRPEMSEGPAEMHMIAYGVSKLGMHALTRAFAHNGAPFNITANTVCPGMVITENIDKRLTPEKYAEESAAIPLGRGATGEEIADAVLFPIRNGYVTGETININGGMYYAP